MSLEPCPPAWVQHLLREAKAERIDLPDLGCEVEWLEGDGVALLAFRVPDARKLDEKGFGAIVESCYATCHQLLLSRGRRPLRFWNYIPAIGERFDNGLSRYETFNSGRMAVHSEESERAIYATRRVCATGIDVRRSDFALHVLAADHPATPVDNPRQLSPHRYSRRYGPVPPAFARAARLPAALLSLPGVPDAMVSGTASIVGEATRHPADLEAQLTESTLNLASVVEALRGRKPRWAAGAALSAEATDALAHYRSVRLYVRRCEDETRVRDWAGSHFPRVDAAELVGADLCRPDLLVEIEGTVSLRS